MSERYLLSLKKSSLVFSESKIELPEAIFAVPFLPPDDTIWIVCRLGDPRLLSCSVFKRADIPGGVFVARDDEGPLYAAVAPDNLTYAAALGYFGELTSCCRYGVDIYENLEETDE